jgi:hypothetical protein
VSWYCSVLQNVFPAATLVVVLLAIFLSTMVRKAEGAFPSVLQDILGCDWTRPYSLKTLVETTGLAGGWDILLMATFSLFVVVGPAVRAVLCVLDFAGCTPERLRPTLTMAIDFIGAFCAWEVVFIAIIMVSSLLPNITDTIISNPECKLVSPDGTCLKVAFELQRTFALIAVGGFLLLGEAIFAVHAGRKTEAENESLASSQEIVVEAGVQDQLLNGTRCETSEERI